MNTQTGRSWGGGLRTNAATHSGWEMQAVEAVGDVVAFWGFKHNQGRIWALLYLRRTPMSAAELQVDLGLSKGAVSMLTRDLEDWEIINRACDPHTGTRMYSANTDMMKMISQVILRRESGMIQGARNKLQEAEALARQEGASAEMLLRLQEMVRLADTVEQALHVFIRTAQLDLRKMVGALRASALRIRSSKSKE